jgi:cytoskeletal protein RodZ
MANRFDQQKPDPAIKKDVIRARQDARSGKNGKTGKGLVVTASLAATLLGWALFSHEDAQTAVTAQVANTTQAVATATSTPAASASQSAAMATATPAAVAITRSSQ